MRAWTRLLPAFIYLWLVERHCEVMTFGKQRFHYDGRRTLVKSRKQ
jgi:hypothetical protein